MAIMVTRLVLVVAPELLLVALQLLDEALRRDDACAPLLRADLRMARRDPAQFWLFWFRTGCKRNPVLSSVQSRWDI